LQASKDSSYLGEARVNHLPAIIKSFPEPRALENSGLQRYLPLASCVFEIHCRTAAPASDKERHREARSEQDGSFQRVIIVPARQEFGLTDTGTL